MAAEKEISMLTYLAIYFMTASISITVGVSIVAGTRAMANIINEYEDRKGNVQDNLTVTRYMDNYLTGNEVINAVINLYYLDTDSIQLLNVAESNSQSIKSLDEVRAIIPITDYESNILRNKGSNVTLDGYNPDTGNIDYLKIRDQLGLDTKGTYYCTGIYDENGSVICLNFELGG